MKKLASLILTLTLLFALSACNTPAGDREGSEASNLQHPTDVTLTTSDGDVSAQSKNQNAPATFSTPQTNNLISRQNAIDIALKAAGLSQNQVFDLEAELDREKNGTKWEVDFETQEKEYSYEIDAVTGKILQQEIEKND
ncbi:MAG: PepSY domain-containing protein [Clostridia bacterium]|nr:PepSY domain-containing protein [Clostridia bacterium]